MAGGHAGGHPGGHPGGHAGRGSGNKNAPKNAGSGRGGNRGAFSGGLYQPNQTLSGKDLNTAAGQIADAQTKGPLSELARQMATQQSQTAAAQQKTFGYYMQLAKDAQAGLSQTQQTGQQLAGQLQGINQQQQGALAGYGQQATGGALSRLAALGLDAGQTQALQADAARQQATGAQNAAAFQSAGANQSANYTGMAASNLGTQALRGQERIGDIGRAGLLSLEPLRAKQGALIAQRGALKGTALGQLRTQERNYGIAKAGLNLKQQDITATNARTAAEIAAANARNAATIAGENTRNADSIHARLVAQGMSNTAAWNRTKAIIQGENQRAANKGSSGGGGSALPKRTPTGTPTLTPAEQQRLFGDLDKLPGLIHQMQQPLSAQVAKGYGLPAGTRLTAAQIRNDLINGQNPAGIRFEAGLIDPGYALAGWGYLTQKQVTELNKLGLIVGNRYKRAPAPRSPAGIGKTLGGTF